MEESWERVGHLQGSLGPSGPETPTKSEKSLPGPPAPGPPESLEKVWKKSRKGPEKTFSKLFPDSLGAQGRRPRETFFRFFGVSGPEGPRDACKWPTGFPRGIVLPFWFFVSLRSFVFVFLFFLRCPFFFVVLLSSFLGVK